MLNIRAPYVFDPKNPPKFRTQVQFRPVGSSKLLQKVFAGATHAADALAFVKEHVAALTDEEYKKASAISRKDRVRKLMSSRPEEASVYMWVRLRHVWDWHVLVPVCSDARAHA